MNISELLPDEPLPNTFEDEIHFNNTVREYILFGVLLIILSVASHIIVLRFKRQEAPILLSHHLCSHGHSEDDEDVVDRVALWLCTFSLAISLGAVLLLPISILSSEVLIFYQDSSYVRWINLSLIQGLWNMIFLFSNLSLFVGLPFAYLFTEAEGFPGSKKGLRSRIVETVVVLSLLVVLVLGVSFILSFLFGYFEDKTFMQTLDMWGSFYLPFLYSIISCLGVLFLLLCTPLGLTRLFTALGQIILKSPGFLVDIKDEYENSVMAEQSLAYQMQRRRSVSNIMMSRQKHLQDQSVPFDEYGFHVQLFKKYKDTQKQREKLYHLQRVGVIRRTLAYPLALLLLLAFTGTAVIIVGLNTLQLLIGIKALPLSSSPALLGVAQQGKRIVFLSILGPVGAVLEVLLIWYLIAASVVGCYSLPGLRDIRPIPKDTPMTHILLNCVVLLLLSSALPLLVRTLGITNFDLLGDYGEISWLGNFWIVLSYNILFATAAVWCLFKKITATLWQGVMLRFQLVGHSLWRKFTIWPFRVVQGSLVMGGNIKEE